MTFDPNQIDGNDTAIIGGTDGTHIGNVGDRLKVDAEMVLKGTCLYSAITVSTAAVEVKVGTSRLANRQAITIQPLTNAVFFGYDNSVTVLTGSKIFKGQAYTIGAKDVPVWLIASASTDVRIGEVS